MSESNMCGQCGGIKNGIHAQKVVNTLNMAQPEQHHFVCYGHSEESRHDGKLDQDGHYTVSHDTGRNDRRFHYVRIEGKFNLGDDEISLSPSQALSLLAWLEQERATLEQMAKEQEG